ncbi:hypothetical protein AT2G06555 [Arabidopsis thaliana]|uniref:Uncharacterized protein n=1 Tax=Arabidopsis thaliana TaxID=3702 RepID=F4IJB1_ARATH|nr:uncharacterized protein AT2G06555 [Arabidopsis thaliana]AEC06015.1 hypothetical protein AT2G06555 [Arabidopsis thaliana]|eukprot:NP_671788.1 hypothetical protein AT2G06555 [Arabidopsis thaliana]
MSLPVGLLAGERLNMTFSCLPTSFTIKIKKTNSSLSMFGESSRLIKVSAKKKAKLSSVEQESLKRPIGVKAAKASAKSKEKDLTVKERLSKHKLLDSLLNRSNGLSDMEIQIKNSLIQEYLSGSNVFVSENEYSDFLLEASDVGKERRCGVLMLECRVV